MAAEKQFENKVKKYLESLGIYPLGLEKQKIKATPIGYYEKRWGGGQFTKKGLPDMHIVINGINIDVELKAPNGKPSELQLHNIKQIDDSGSYAILLYPNQYEIFQSFINALICGMKKNAETFYEELKRK